MIIRSPLRAPVVYVLVQAVAYGLDIGSFGCAHYIFGVDPIASNVVGKLIAGSFAFVAHRNITFLAAKEPIVAQALKYCMLLAANTIVASALLYIFLRALPEATVSKIASDLIMIVISFLASRYFVFNAHKAADQR